MLVKTFSSTVAGIDARTITVEVNISTGIKFFIVGLPDNAVKESEQRVIAAFANNNLHMPGAKIVVNLSPADLRKEGSHYDLPIAIGILAASGQVPTENIERYIILGELSLDGLVLPVKGALPIAIQALKDGFKGIILPSANAREAAVVQNIKVLGVNNIKDVIDILQGGSTVQPTIINTREEYFSQVDKFDIDFSEVKGQESIKRAFEIAAAGGHNIMVIGPPGSGKSMLAARMPSIMPPMTLNEALEVTKIHSVAGKMSGSGGLVTKRPFRAPHHIISDVAMVGGGNTPQPGEISLAHNGILFLDEMPEFSRHVLEVMRQPLEEHKIAISRARYAVEYPANFMLIGAMNPCPCGFLTHPEKDCTCTPAQLSRYAGKISGPLMDRIDMHIEAVPVAIDAITGSQSAETSAQVRKRVVAARNRQIERFGENSEIYCNALMPPNAVETYCKLSESSLEMLKTAMNNLGLSARAYNRILKVARTIADLNQSDDILPDHLAEAISYRSLDRKTWGIYTL